MNPQAPGVYIEEVDSGSQTITTRSTGIAAFVGLAPDGDASVNRAVKVYSARDFDKKFASRSREPTDLALAVHGFFMNSGGSCYVINTGSKGPLSPECERRLDELDDVSMVAAPGATSAADYDLLISHCEKRSPADRMAILDLPGDVENIDGLVETATVEVEGPGTRKRDPEADARPKGLRPRQSLRGLAACYFPGLIVSNPYYSPRLDGSLATVKAPPSGAIAGIWSKSPAHKPPANEIIAGALGVTYPIVRAEQERLNPAGVNCIINFKSSGTTVWGARTLAASASELCYVNVRRLFCAIQTAISIDTRGYVFRPNDHKLWKIVRSDVSNFLRGQWRAGALHGRTPEEAFFVKCDEDTNPPESIREGKLVIEIGIAPVRPAEFVLFRIGHKESGSDNEEVSNGG